MDILINIIQSASHFVLYYVILVLVVLGIMIFFHELGHFLAAKYFGVKVLKFALGFGPKITGKTFGETEYSIRYFPLGGFVKMLGEDENDEESEDISSEDEKRAFNHQHSLKRIAIVAAGPIFNLILAFLLYFGLYLSTGSPLTPPEIGAVTDGQPAQRAGFMKGDIITSVGEKNVKNWSDIIEFLEDKAGVPVVITVRRNNELISFSVIPEEDEEEKRAVIGVVIARKVNPFEAFREAFWQTWMWIKLTCIVVVKLFQGVISFKTVGGPIMIGQITGQIAQENAINLVPLIAIISINLGILNLFPIPVLDGGVILFLFVELLIGRPLSIKKRQFAQKIGISLLIALTLIVFYNDILRLFQ